MPNAEDHTRAESQTESLTVERLSPEEAFGVLGHELRFGILEALNDAEEPLPFSELRERVGVRDSGQFNYHLGELIGRFVNETEDGYLLAPSGKQVVGAVFSGGFTKEMESVSVDTEAPCVACGEPMEARFREGGIAVECPDCGMQYTDPDLPPSLVEGRSQAAIPSVVDAWLQRTQLSAQYGLCQYCDGRMEETVFRPDNPEIPDWFEGDPAEFPDIAAMVLYECQRCGYGFNAVLEAAVVTHPAVMGFHHEHGIDVRETPMWALPWFDITVATTVSEDPLRFELPIELDDERRVFTFDHTLDVVETETVGVRE